MEQIAKFIPVCKPLLPLAEKLKPYLERIDANRYYSNMGPLVLEFEQKLASHFGVTQDEVLTSTNGTLALMQIFKAYDLCKGKLCVMPSWTFTATPAAALMAGLNPYFIDVDKHTWAIRPKDVFALLEKGQDVGAVVIVSPFGAPIEIDEWEQFHASTHLPVIIDAAAGFDSFSYDFQKRKTSLPFMVSLHATKVIGIGEGAVIITNNPDLTEKMRLYGNFGFKNYRESFLPGINTKMSEYAAAVGLAAFSEWPEKRKAWQQLSTLFDSCVKQIPHIQNAPAFNQKWIASYGLIVLKHPFNGPIIKQALANYNIETISWWGKGCHAQTTWKNFPRNTLSVTEDLANQVLGLPFWLGLEKSNVDYIFSCLDQVLSLPINESVSNG